jgi:transcription factor SPEECHLESS
MMGDIIADLFSESEFGSTPEDLLRILETLEEGSLKGHAFCQTIKTTQLNCQKDGGKTITGNEEAPMVGMKRKRTASLDSPGAQHSPTKVSHITVERNRRKQMNEHLTILRSLMPCFYVKRVRKTSSL